LGASTFHKVRVHGAILRTPLYTYDVSVFAVPVKEDIQNLSSILNGFEEVIGLCTNFQKNYVPICCGNIDLDDILDGLPTARTTSPLRYLVLPLSVWRV
jgi:hypothetical protein